MQSVRKKVCAEKKCSTKTVLPAGVTNSRIMYVRVITRVTRRFSNVRYFKSIEIAEFGQFKMTFFTFDNSIQLGVSNCKAVVNNKYTYSILSVHMCVF